MAVINVSLDAFEGPLDLLLHLIRETRLDIATIPLASVTGQYMQFLSQLDTLDLNLASEFIEVGATLMDIKARRILPRPADEEEEESPEAQEERLKQRLEEYKLLKEAGEQLKSQENVNRFYKPAEELKTITRWNLEGLSIEDLSAAFAKIMFRIQKEATPTPERQIRLDRFTVADKMKFIRAELGGRGRFSFFSLFESDYSKGEIINTFLAILELLKTSEIKAVQSDKFGDIEIKRGEAAETIQIEEGDLTYGNFEIVDGIDD